MDSFKTLQDEISKALVSTTRSATRISSADIPFQRSLNPEVGTALDSQNARLLHLAQRLLQNAAASSDAVGPKLPDVEAIDANWRGVVDVIDSLLEKADTSLDEYTGVVRRLSPSAEQAAVKPRPNIAERKIIAKPQLTFEHVPTNDDKGGFRPLITSKPHAKVPIEDCLKTFKDYKNREQYPHPYQAEIESYEYPSFLYQHAEPQQYPPFESTTATFVDTPEALAVMLEELKTAKEIAIDLEHHDNRSYIGMVSLMQISTRDKDWIVDTLKPWRRKLECLNEVFADPNILKVLHGAFMDIIWLQRDLGLYVVGLFDTFHAARSLGYPAASLAYLLERFINFKAQKQYQLADWRIRPLGPELFEYARADTHFLLYIFDNMRNELVEKSDFSDSERNKVQDVLTKSKETALQRYEHPVYDNKLGLGPVGWYKLISRTPVQFTSQQFSVFRAVHQWRDALSRKEDESPFFIMPNHAVFSVSRALPADKPALLLAIQHVSHIMRARADELLGVIAEAKKDGVNGPELNDVLKTIADMREADIVRSEAQIPKKVIQASPTPALQQTILSSTVAIPALRASASDFWGKLWQGSPTAQERSMPIVDIDLALPLPPLTAEIFADTNQVIEQATLKAEQSQHTFVPKEDRPQEDQRTDIFVVKQLGGRKRKRAEDQSPTLDPMTNDEISLDPAAVDKESEEAAAKQEKAARKAAKKLKKREQAAQAAALNDNDEPAFDYANAPTILHANDNDGKKKKDKKEKKKKAPGFNPFGGLTDAPKGLPRAQKEIAGRSRTFKS
ncbi:exosome complex exonuclease-like protein Rrp6 [Dothidotthia symphoricarpi CBS 119687]|uniref:Exosome complex exonuclease-like protein Rrp6 n=1 Tax=Dothidotthia symphoricarpi CBS 119687 TaxID=1392245 RepID=A0A6A6AHC8_9PLEO|nr:exosome complex exonuclease-like protein Rrp6 [Dothidotthia symphoricarpi CBS 119687]KAF2129851.1 exosome complex exonuclease-like protein Rrp6 [Dothidotthia symphoricarpi CBS 119687]